MTFTFSLKNISDIKSISILNQVQDAKNFLFYRKVKFVFCYKKRVCCLRKGGLSFCLGNEWMSKMLIKFFFYNKILLHSFVMAVT